MQKILLIEDNTKRQKDFYSGKSLNTEYNDILNNAIDDEYKNIFKQLKQKIILNYDFIAVHASAFGGDNEIIIKYLKQAHKDKNIIFFSGGIHVKSYQLNPQILYVPEKDFYENLELFLQSINEVNTNIQILGYGKDWEVNTLNTVYKEIRKIDKNKIRFKLFKKKTQLDLIKHLIDEPELNNGFIEKSSIESLEIIIKKLLDKKMSL